MDAQCLPLLDNEYYFYYIFTKYKDKKFEELNKLFIYENHLFNIVDSNINFTTNLFLTLD